jgi:hypothetical protein
MTFAAELGDFGVPKSFEVRLWSTSPQKAAQIILNGVRKNRARILVGPDIRLLDLLVRISGSAYQRLVPPVARRFTAPLR